MARILLVEDHEIIRDTYYIGLVEAGLTVDTAGTGAEALTQVEKRSYDLILLDVVMLSYSGIEFLEAFRAKQPSSKTKVIMLSNLDSPNVMQRAKQLGVSKYYLKAHFTPQQLANAVLDELKVGPAAPKA